jgi:hypothetical protein
MTDMDEDRALYRVEPIGADEDSQAKRDWRVLVNDKELETPVASVRLINDKMGREVIYGWRPEGFDGVMMHEPGGGGAVTIPWLRVQNDDGSTQIFIGLTKEHRGPVGGTILNVPRGFIDPGADHLSTAHEETREETGHAGTDRLMQLGVPLNANSDAYNTSGVADDGQPEGVRLYALEVTPGEVERVGEAYRFIPEIRERVGSKSHERIYGTVFVPITKASQSPDNFTRAAVGDLLILFMQQGLIKF